MTSLMLLPRKQTVLLACFGLMLFQGTPLMAADPAKQACMADAKRLCAKDVKAMSRSRVRACLIAHMEQTSAPCHTFMVQARDAVLSGRKPDRSAQ